MTLITDDNDGILLLLLDNRKAKTLFLSLNVVCVSNRRKETTEATKSKFSTKS